MSILKNILVLSLVLLISFLSITYFTAPLREISLVSKQPMPEPDQIITGNQFYPNMRFQEGNISYQISDKCTLIKKNQMTRAFEIIEEKTILNFYPSSLNEQITVTCQELDKVIEDKINPNYFIAGEGGPTEIISTNRFSIINKGSILLIRNSNCPNPNIAIHELLHVLGFDHSNNPKDIMYNVTDCDQAISLETLNKINKLYSIPSKPDLELRNVSAYVHSRYLDTNMTIVNEGLKESPATNLSIFVDNQLIDNFEIEYLKPGQGRTIMLKNFYIPKRNFESITFEIITNFEELEKKNNKIKLETSV